MQLDYTGLTQEQILCFIENTDLSVEIDAYFSMKPTINNVIEKGEIETDYATGHVSGVLLGIDIGDAFDYAAEDLIKMSLDFFKQANGDLQLAAKLLAKHLSL